MMQADFVRRSALGGDAGVNTLNLKIIPIIFVPGVMGSRLLIRDGLNWDPDSPVTMVQWSLRGLDTKRRWLSVDLRPTVDIIGPLSSGAAKQVSNNENLTQLAAATSGREPADFYASRGWGGVAWGFYGTILVELETALNIAVDDMLISPCPVYAFGYDWRRSNLDSGAELLAFIGKVLANHRGAKQVIIVTHSMGGLVARAAIATNPAVNGSILTVIHGAQPANGAVVAYRRCLTGATSQLDGASGGFMDKIGASVLNRLMGTTRHDYVAIQAGLAGPVQLMPNHLYHRFDRRGPPWLQTNPPAMLDLVYGIYTSPLVPPGVLFQFAETDLDREINAAFSMRLIDAAFFHQLVGTRAHPKTHVLFSTGLGTDVGVDLTTTAGTPQKEALGDGTVPAVSGECAHFDQGTVLSRTEFQGLEHAAVYQDAAWNALVLNLVRGAMLDAP